MTNTSGNVRVAIVDDDQIAAAGFEACLNEMEGVEVLAKSNQMQALEWSNEVWADVDVLIVDIHDESQLDIPGEDTHTGIDVVEHTRDFSCRVVALVPSMTDVYLKARLVEAKPDEVHSRRGLDVARLESMVFNPDEFAAPQALTDAELMAIDADHGVTPNRFMAVYDRSPLRGKLGNVPQKALERAGVSRRQILNLREDAQENQFGEGSLSVGRFRRSLPGWRHTRVLILRLGGRHDEADGQ